MQRSLSMQLELVGVDSQVETSWKWGSFSSLSCRKEPGLNMLGNLSFAVHDTSMVQSQLFFRGIFHSVGLCCTTCPSEKGFCKNTSLTTSNQELDCQDCSQTGEEEGDNGIFWMLFLAAYLTHLTEWISTRTPRKKHGSWWEVPTLYICYAQLDFQLHHT